MKDFNKMAENVLKRRDAYVIERRIQMKKLTAIISCFCLCTIIGATIWIGGAFETPTTPNGDMTDTQNSGEAVPEQSYHYKINDGQFSAFVPGKVIAEDKIGDKISDVTLTAGWRDADDTAWLSQEKLRGEVYTINGIGNDVAVALKFIDKGEAVTTTHYYVIMDPNADLSAVEDYIIRTIAFNNAGDIVPE